MTALKKLVTKSALRIVDLDMLNVDTAYQREVRPGHKKIIADFNEQALGIPLIGEREDSTLWIVDGLQRITALKALGKTKARVEVFASKGVEHEAEVFKLVNLNRTRLKPMEEFKALLAAHDKESWTIKELVEACGYKLGGNGLSADQVRCVGALQRIYRCWGHEALKFTLITVREAWPGDSLNAYGELLSGMAMFYNNVDGVVDLERLYPRLRLTTPQKVLYMAKQQSMSTRVVGDVCEVIKKLYSKKMRKS